MQPPRTRLTAQGPRSRNLPSRSSARSRCTWLSSTCRAEGWGYWSFWGYWPGKTPPVLAGPLPKSGSWECSLWSNPQGSQLPFPARLAVAPAAGPKGQRQPSLPLLPTAQEHRKRLCFPWQINSRHLRGSKRSCWSLIKISLKWSLTTLMRWCFTGLYLSWCEILTDRLAVLNLLNRCKILECNV